MGCAFFSQVFIFANSIDAFDYSDLLIHLINDWLNQVVWIHIASVYELLVLTYCWKSMRTDTKLNYFLPLCRIGYEVLLTPYVNTSIWHCFSPKFNRQTTPALFLLEDGCDGMGPQRTSSHPPESKQWLNFDTLSAEHAIRFYWEEGNPQKYPCTQKNAL